MHLRLRVTEEEPRSPAPARRAPAVNIGRHPSGEEARILERFGFQCNVAYMEVPRCERCELRSADGHCSLLGQTTATDFGCVGWVKRG